MTDPLDPARRALEQHHAFVLATLNAVGSMISIQEAGDAIEREWQKLLPLLSAAPREETPAARCESYDECTFSPTACREFGCLRTRPVQPPPRPETDETPRCQTCEGVSQLIVRRGYTIIDSIEDSATRYQVAALVDEIVRGVKGPALQVNRFMSSHLFTPPPPASAAPATEERSSRNIPTCFCGHAIISCGYDHETSRVYGKCDACGGMLLGPTRSDWLRHAPAPAERERRE